MSTLTFNETTGRYEMAEEGHTVFARVRHKDGVVYIDYVEAPEALRGTGAAGRFMEALMKQIGIDGRKAIPVCGYASTWLQRHPEHSHLIYKA